MADNIIQVLGGLNDNCGCNGECIRCLSPASWPQPNSMRLPMGIAPTRVETYNFAPVEPNAVMSQEAALRVGLIGTKQLGELKPLPKTMLIVGGVGAALFFLKGHFDRKKRRENEMWDRVAKGINKSERIGRQRNSHAMSRRGLGELKTTIKKDSDTGEFVVKLFKDGKHQKDADYFTSDKADAQATAKAMIRDHRG